MLVNGTKEDYSLCMSGTIRVFQKCRCGSRFEKSGDVFVCTRCGANPTRYVVDIHYRGKRVRIYSDKYGTPLDSLDRANRTLEGIRYEIDNGTFDPCRYIKRQQNEFRFDKRMSEWVRDYEKSKRRGNIAPSYLKLIKLYSKRYFVPFFKKEDLRDINTKRIKDYSDWLPEKFSRKYRKNILDTLEKFFNDMRKLELIERVPIFPNISVPDPAINWCDIETQEMILNEIPAIHQPIFWFIAKEGVRPGEARALMWGDVDFDNNLVCIRRTFSAKELRDTTKGGHGDWLPIHPKAREIMFGLPRKSMFVFTFRGRPYAENTIPKIWNAACKKLNIEGLSLYQGTRHSLASDAVRRGLSLYDVQSALRHRDYRTTQKYAHMKLEGKMRVLLGSDKVVRFPNKGRKE